MSDRAALRVRFWGVRGSFPVPGPRTAKVGGNSSCVEITAGDQTLIFDAGTGIIGLGERLVKQQASGDIHIFLSHMHHDHIEGLRFFQPFYRKDWRCTIYGPESRSHPLAHALKHMMQPRFFPVEFGDLQARLEIRGLDDRVAIDFGGRPPLRVESLHSEAHPKFGIQLYRISRAGRSIVYATDVEAPLGGFEAVTEFANGADLLIHDAQYTEHEYFRTVGNKQGWGHSTVKMAAATATAAGVGRLVLFHHDPIRTDAQVPKLETEAKRYFRNSTAAREGMTISLPAATRTARASASRRRGA